MKIKQNLQQRLSKRDYKVFYNCVSGISAPSARVSVLYVYANRDKENIHHAYTKIYNIIKKYNITDFELRDFHSRVKIISYKPGESLYNKYKTGTTLIRRDNKGIINGRGYNYTASIRYPSKKRSRSTWKKFYETFPFLAHKDNWGGSK